MTTVLDNDLAFGDTAAASFTPDQVKLQGPFRSTSGVLLSGIDAAKWTVVGRNAAGKLVLHDPTATVADVDAYATGLITFTGQPVADDTITINGHAITFKASGAGANQLNIAGTATLTAQALKAMINTGTATYLVTATGDGLVLALQANTAGTAGNAYTTTESATNVTVGGATLTGGDTGFTVPAPESYVAGVLAQASDATDADLSVPYFLTGTFQHDKLVWHASLTTLALRQSAMRGTPLWVDNLK